MVNRVVNALFALVLIGPVLFAAGCVYDLSLEGKRCDATHPCPTGNTCVQDGTQQVCAKSGSDAGIDDGDGGDGGDTDQCLAGDIRCNADLSGLETCEAGGWTNADCPSEHYCLYIAGSGLEPTCEALCVNSQACPQGTWCKLETAHCEAKGDCAPAGVQRCSSGLDQVIRCDEESGYEVVDADCTPDIQYCDPFDPACKDYCVNDLGCANWPGTSCEPVSRKCVALDLCFEDNECAAGSQCVEGAGACARIPTEQGLLSTGGQPSLSCYIGDPTSPADNPASCTLRGRVVDFYGRTELADSIGLVVRVHHLDDVLAGVLGAPIVSSAAVDDNGVGQYSLQNVPTNTHLVLEVQGRQGGPNPPPFGFASMLTFGLYLRADDCDQGSISFAAPTIFQTNYDGYANVAWAGLVAEVDKGLLFGQLRDCDGFKITESTAGLSMEHELLYYLSSGMPAEGATATDSSGFFVAANVTPIRGVVSALVLSAAVTVSLWTKPVRVFPGSASLVLFEEPQAPR